jgi:DNA-binding HxlR family transcriptional regulator
MALRKIYDPGCALEYAFNRIGGKYKGRILWNFYEGDLRYTQLKKRILGISTKMLTQTLRELEEDNLISRTVFHEVPLRVEYALTPTGQELIPFIAHLRGWAEKELKNESHQPSA